MRCRHCDFDNPPGLKFCGGCGSAAPSPCATCGFENPRGFRFCGECGAPLDATAPKPTEAERRHAAQGRSARDYTPRHLAERILTSRSALEGERKQVTVLFADLEGSMRLSEDLDPEAWHGVLDRFLQILADGVHRFEGTVNQYTGDGIMALFGAPLAHEDHAQRACYAALHLRDVVRAYADELRVAQGLNFSVRMGLNSGEVVVGRIGDDLRMDYTAQGHVVGLAQRMEQLAESGRILMTDATARLVEGYFSLRDLGSSRVKGAREPVGVRELEGAGPLRTRFDRSRDRGLARFVGRETDMAQLESALERAVAGSGGTLGVVAEAGAGKSRLCFEFAERCRARGISVRTAHGISHGKMLAFLPILELLRDVFEIEARDPPELARHKVAGALLLRDGGFARGLPLLFDFLGIPDAERPSPPLPADERQRRIVAMIARLLEQRSEREVGVIVIEDLHWIDAGTESFLSSMVELAERSRTLLLVNFRPEYRAPWMRRSSYQQLSLAALGPADLELLLRELLGDDDSLEPLVERIRERTGGNPFFAEETVRALAESGVLEGNRGGYRLRGNVDELALPDSVQSLLGARIDRLGEVEKQVLQAASVVGRRFDETLLLEAAGGDARSLAEALSALVDAELVYETARYPERELVFSHALTQEVAYRSQLRDRRSQMHAKVARALAAQIPAKGEPGRADERIVLVAHHSEAAGEKLEAARWYRRAAEGRGLTAPAESASHWRKVRELTQELPSSSERDALALLACVQLVATGGRTGEPYEQIAEFLEEGEALARRSGDRLSLVRLVSAAAAHQMNTLGLSATLIPRLREAVETAARAPSSERR